MDYKDSFSAMFKRPVVSADEQELRDWLKKNRELLKDHSSDTVVYFALLNQFPRDLVYSVLSDFRDAMQGSHIENRAAMEAYRFEAAMEDVQRLRDAQTYIKELDLRPLWKDLHTYQTGIVFEEAA